MRPVPIPETKVWEGAIRQSILAPDGLEDLVGACDAIIDKDDELGVARFCMLIQAEGKELEMLHKNGGKFWLVIHSNFLVPFGFEVREEE